MDQRGWLNGARRDGADEMPPSDAIPRPIPSPTPNADHADAGTPAEVLACLSHVPNRGPLRFFGKVGTPEVIGDALTTHGGRFFAHVCDDGVAMRAATHLAGFHGVLETRSGTAPPMVVHGDAHGTAYLAAGDDTPPGAYDHEFTHLLFDAYGYVTDRDALHDDSSGAGADAGAAADGDAAAAGEGSPATAVGRERAYRRGSGPDPFVEAPTPDASGASNLELRQADPAVAPKAAASHPDVAALADAVNASWWKIHRTARESPERLPAVLPRPGGDDANVVSVHAHELAAVWGEVFLEGGTPTTPANWFFEHPELTAAFCRVVRPSSGVCRVANHLHRAFPDRSPWAETPYPTLADADGDDDAPDVATRWAAAASTWVGTP